MADNSVSYLSLINQQVAFKEKIQEYLLKAESVATVALNRDFIEHDQSIIHHYLWVLCDVISHAKDINEQALSNLLNHSVQTLKK